MHLPGAVPTGLVRNFTICLHNHCQQVHKKKKTDQANSKIYQILYHTYGKIAGPASMCIQSGW